MSAKAEPVSKVRNGAKKFGTAGVRGVFNVSQTAEEVYRLVLASAFVFGRGKYGVGWDGRKTSMLLARTVASAISATGSEAVLFGQVPTPVIAFGTREAKCKLGFSVTASHNPPEYSGVKIFNSKGMELSKLEEDRIERAMMVGTRMESKDYGPLNNEPILEKYIGSLVTRFQRVDKGLRIGIDCSNGPGGLITPKVLRLMGHEVVPLNTQISWRFPARLPEPTAQNLSETASILGSIGVDIGFAHDGDADRLVMISSSGKVLPDSLVSVMAMKALVNGSGIMILSENSSSAVEDEALRLGLKVVRSRIGKTFVEIEREGAIFATEPSKIVDPSWGMWEDGLYAAVLISGALARDRRLLDYINSDPVWHFRQVNLPVAMDYRVMSERAIEVFERFRISETRRMDGLKLVFSDRSWIMFRASGTETKTRIYCESLDPIKLDELLQTGRSMLNEMSKNSKAR
jgi:phosphopentomutase